MPFEVTITYVHIKFRIRGNSGEKNVKVNLFRLANFEGNLSSQMNHASTGSGLSEYVVNLFDASLSWEDISWLKR